MKGMENKMPITNKDIEVMIRIENIVGMNEKKLFDDNGNFHYVETYYKDGKKYTEPETVTMEDFVDYINIVEKVLLERESNRKKVKEYMRERRKIDPDYGHYYVKKKGEK